MAGALVHGGPGTEIALNALLPSHLRGASRQRRESVAREYEAHNPGAVVVCDWEIVSDADIALMETVEERDQALADRAALAARRAAAAQLGTQDDPKMGGDPERARELLRRQRNEISTLDIRSEGYKKRFIELADSIHLLEDAVGEPRTKYQLGDTIESPIAKLAPHRQKELRDKVNKYRTLPRPNRLKSIEDAKDPILSQLLFDVETEQPIRDAWLLKLVELGAVAAT